MAKLFLRSFAGGEISPSMYARIDDAVYQSGAKTVRNFVVWPQGALLNRNGTRHVAQTKYSNRRTIIIPFQFSSSQSMAIEVGHEYMRFHTQGLTLMLGGSPYEIETPYQEEDLSSLKYEQSNDVVTITHKNYATQELRRLGATAWELREASFEAPIDPPTTVSVTAYMPASAGVSTDIYRDCNYVVTSVNGDDQESGASSEESGSNQLYITGAKNTISWGSVSGAEFYRVYKESGGIFGFIGETSGTSIVDDGIAPDMGRTPPIYDNPFSDVGKILSVPVTSGGSGYGENGGVVTGIRLLSTATYGINVSRPTGEIVDPTGSGAEISLSTREVDLPGDETNGWKITGATLLDGGSGYTNPSVLMDDTPIVSGKTEWEVDFTPNDITFLITDAGGGSGAELEAVVSSGVLTGIVVRNGGKGYVNPVVTITDGRGGSGAVLGAPVIGSSTDNPGTVSYHDQRKWLGGSKDKPQYYWATRPGTESDMSYTIPQQDDNRIANKLAARSINEIRHLVSVDQLIALTNTALWVISSPDGVDNPITPTSLKTRLRNEVGASDVRPVVAAERIIYESEKSNHIIEFAYQMEAGGYIAGDLSIRSTHLFDGFRMISMCKTDSPVPMIWGVSSSGKLLSMTYVPEQRIASWSWHDTDGVFESAASVSEDGKDVIYCVVQRYINGSPVRYIEMLHMRQSVDDNPCHVDCGIVIDRRRYDGETVTVTLDDGDSWDGTGYLKITASTDVFDTSALGSLITDQAVFLYAENQDGSQLLITLNIDEIESATVAYAYDTGAVPESLQGVATADWAYGNNVVSELDHLEGKAVTGLVDGAEIDGQTVSGGEITLTTPYAEAVIGLPFYSDLATLPATMQVDGYGKGRTINVNNVTVLTDRTSGLFAGPSFDELTEFRQRLDESYGVAPKLKTGQQEIVVAPKWGDDGSIYVRQKSPVPVTILGITIDATVGGS